MSKTLIQKRNNVIVKCIESVLHKLYIRKKQEKHTHTQKINHIIVKCVERVSHILFMKKKTQERVHFVA